MYGGDAGFNYNTNELETAARYNLDIVMVVMNNSTMFFDWTQCWEVEDQFPAEVWRQNYDFNSIDFAKVAEGMGCLGITVETPDELQGALERALAYKGPAVVDVRTRVMTKSEVGMMFETAPLGIPAQEPSGS
jgi:acetolactate synthase-1/2/3 large subunit